MFTKLVNNLVHLERGGDRLDENGSTNTSSRNSDQVLRHTEDVVPKTSFEVVLHLGEAEPRRENQRTERSQNHGRKRDVLEVRTESTSEELFGVVEEVETKVED
jgi:hypothetical protein